MSRSIFVCTDSLEWSRKTPSGRLVRVEEIVLKPNVVFFHDARWLGVNDPVRSTEEFVDNSIVTLAETVGFYGDPDSTADQAKRGQELIVRMALHLLCSKAFFENAAKF